MEKKTTTMIFIVGLLFTVAMANALVTNNGDGTITWSFTMDTTDAIELRDAMCQNYGYQATIYNDETGIEEANLESCQQFAEKQTKRYFRDNIKAYRYYQAEQAINTGEDIGIE